MTAPVLIGPPVTASRQWTTALAPRTGGGHKFIAQSWSYDVDRPSEWILVNLEEGTYEVTEGPNRIYSQGTHFPSANTIFTTQTQIRSSDGRIWFLQRATPGALTEKFVNVAYYDPADEQMHQLVIEDPNAARHAIVFNAAWDVSGSRLYCGTLSSGEHHPMVFSINPLTAETEVICSVGEHESELPKYAYYLAADGDWLYVAVGQDIWELVAIDLLTNTPTVLLTTEGPGTQRIEFEVRSNGFSANTITNGVSTRYWMADGALSAYPGSGAPPGGARTVTRYTNLVTTPPEIDWSRGIGQVLWRPYGSSGDWTLIEYDVAYLDPVVIESLVALRDGTAFGNAEQYNGFFHYDPRTSVTQWYGAWEGGVSQPALLAVDRTTVYFAGYPSGALYRYDPEDTWDVLENPESLGSFGNEVRYPRFLHLADTGVLYACGRRANDAEGSGLGAYDIDADTFTTMTEGLDDFGPRGFVVLEEAGLLVFSGELLVGTGLTEAPLITYDLDMVEQDRFVPFAGRDATGLLFRSPNEPGVVVGLSAEVEPVMLYRYDVVNGVLLDSVDLDDAEVGEASVAGDGTIWVVIDEQLEQIDPQTLVRRVIADASDIPAGSLFAWGHTVAGHGRSVEQLYLISGTNLYRPARDIPTPHMPAFDNPEQEGSGHMPPGGWP